MYILTLTNFLSFLKDTMFPSLLSIMTDIYNLLSGYWVFSLLLFFVVISVLFPSVLSFILSFFGSRSGSKYTNDEVSQYKKRYQKELSNAKYKDWRKEQIAKKENKSKK